MRVSHLAVDDFRSYKHAVVEFDPGVTVLVGPNGQGKTNLVEALAYLSTFSSHRVSAEAALVRIPSPEEEPIGGAVVRARLIQGEREHVIELEIVRGKANRARLNRTQARPRDIVGMVKTVVFAPEDLSLIRGEPGVRRSFMDDLTIQKKPLMVQIKSDFDKVAKQRAALMKQAQSRLRRGQSPDLSTIDIWDENFARLSARITAERAALVREMADPAHEAYDKVADSPKQLSLRLDASIDSVLLPNAADGAGVEERPDLEDVAANTERLLAALTHVREREMERGVNLVGAHRDDLHLELGGMPVRGYASHGESWSVALALRLASFEILSDEGEQPILILDDVFAELDARRRTRLAGLVAEVDQVLVTAAVAEDVPDALVGSVLHVRADAEAGTVVTREATDE
ncbi:DNA replication/repair protein RecF [Schaalia sp. Marseille-Q2122]|uniref:DNA replication/repair protein RecF n=1 Tax=Schaalia sp. Marseille-Q2122 TaxID=2736604 RepID=UPI001588658D|nr:DNA replication/repair protein RecF [Schaalia sp. Marseille-Q2122]